MNLSTLKSYIKMGREIEFSYDGVMYSITYTFDDNKQTISFCRFDYSCTDYSTMEEFLASAKVEEEYLRDILENIEAITVY